MSGLPTAKDAPPRPRVITPIDNKFHGKNFTSGQRNTDDMPEVHRSNGARDVHWNAQDNSVPIHAIMCTLSGHSAIFPSAKSALLEMHLQRGSSLLQITAALMN